MSTPNPTPPMNAPNSAPRKREIVIVSHCSLFYWWPVWAVGFILFAITAVAGDFLGIAPEIRAQIDVRGVDAAIDHGDEHRTRGTLPG